MLHGWGGVFRPYTGFYSDRAELERAHQLSTAELERIVALLPGLGERRGTANLTDADRAAIAAAPVSPRAAYEALNARRIDARMTTTGLKYGAATGAIGGCVGAMTGHTVVGAALGALLGFAVGRLSAQPRGGW